MRIRHPQLLTISRMMRWCDHNGVYCVLGLSRNARLERMGQPWTVPAERNYKRTGDKQRVFGAIGYPLQALFQTVLRNVHEWRFAAGGQQLRLPDPST